MDRKRLSRAALAWLLTAALLIPAAAAYAGPGLSDSAQVVAAALREVGYTEGEGEYSKFGAWYGLPNSFWCDMFVSWCAMAGGVPESRFPRDCSCTSHVKQFTEMGRYQRSAARGGDYTPRQGDVIFFYDCDAYPDGKICHHTGLVLYEENGYVYTIEGNALAGRPEQEEPADTPREDGPEQPDYVVVNRYLLDDPCIHGYGVPDYTCRTPLELDGFVDLGRHAEHAGMFQYLCGTGVMPATGEHTFFPNHGMSKGEFLTLTADFFGIPSGYMAARPFDDVLQDSPVYSAAMAARAAGWISGTEDNRLLPDRYITPDEAQAVFDRIHAYLGLEAQASLFSEENAHTPYAIRADLARAFYELCRQMPLSEPFEGKIFFGEQECPARSLDGVCYVAAEYLRRAGPELELTVEAAGIRQMPPMWRTDRVLPDQATLRCREASLSVNSFMHQGILYVDLHAAAAFLALDLKYAEGALPQDCPDGAVTVVRF